MRSLFVAAFITAFITWAFGSAPMFAQQRSAHLYIPDVPSEIGGVEFYLLTGGVGDDLASRYGHTGIRVVDPYAGTDVVFNWGTFDFDEPGFAWKFFRGNVTYRMGVRDYQRDLAIYERAGRSMVEERLNLTPAQKRQLLETIAWNAQPEHRHFKYQYWYKNCATIPRDYLDQVLHGQVHKTFAAREAGKSFRDYVRSNLKAIPFVVPALDVFMNANIDRPINQWEEMFLPAKLREHLLDMPAVDDVGRPIPGSRLLGKTRVLVDFPENHEAPFNDFLAIAMVVIVPLGTAMGLLAMKKRELAFRCLGLATLSWGLVAGGLGLTLLLNWLFSGHEDGWRNANLMLFLPCDFIFVVIGWRMMRARGPIKDRVLFPGSGRALVVGHLVLLLLWGGLAASGMITQSIGLVAAWFGVPMLAVCVALFGVGLRQSPALAGERFVNLPTENLVKRKSKAKTSRA